jgi:HD-like signal output (HDOD) protein
MKRILFVDDEPLVLQGLKAGLYARRNDWEMRFAVGGEKAIECMAEAHFDVLVTDLRMPGVDGAALMARARADSPDTIRIVLSGFADEELSFRVVALAHRYLSKPCESKRLEECVDRCLATQTLVRSEEVRARLGAIGTLPAMPTTFAALQAAIADPTVSLSQVAHLIEQDPGIAAKVLQVCNSAFFRLPRRISNLQQAVTYLGLATVRGMVLSAEIFLPGKTLPRNLDVAQLQRHALSVGGIARLLAADAAWADDAFLSGLLHDVGVLLLARQYPQEMQVALDAGEVLMAQATAEQEVLGIDHGTAGAYLLGLWGLPYEVVETVANHERAECLSRTAFDCLGAVAIAEAVLAEIRPEDTPRYEKMAPAVDDRYLRMLGFPHSWNALVERADAMLNADAA